MVVVGLGQLGTLFAEGWLRRGHPVFPVTRDTSIAELSLSLPEPGLVLVAVAETDLTEALGSIPPRWRGRLALLQNELVPADWERRGFPEPSVAVVWFERKRGMPPTVVAPTLLSGPGAGSLADALSCFDVPVRQLASSEELARELLRKNLYILTSNLAGMRVGGTTGALVQEHWQWATLVAEEVFQVQSRLCCTATSLDVALDSLREDLLRVPEHLCTGRSAPARLARTLGAGARLGLTLPVLAAIAAESEERLSPLVSVRAPAS